MIHLITEGGNSDLKNRMFPIPKGVYKHLKKTLSNYNGDMGVDGYKRLNNLINMGKISYQEMKRLKNYFDTYQGDINSTEYLLNGGDELKTWVNNTLNTAIKSIHDYKQAKKDAGISNAFIKSHNKDRQTHNSLKPTQSKFKTNDINNRIKNNDTIKYESKRPKMIFITEEQLNIINEAEDSTFNLQYLSTIPSFRGRYNYCVQHIGNHVGKGSSRATFQLSDEKVLKLAINAKGIAQNEQEGTHDYYLEQLDVVPRLYDSDDDYKWIISEYVLPAKSKDFKECLGIDEQSFFRFIITSWLNHCAGSNKRGFYYRERLSDEVYNELMENEDLIGWDDYVANYNPPLGDMLRRANYGMTLREGHPTIVLLDNGLTEDIYNNFYRR